MSTYEYDIHYRLFTKYRCVLAKKSSFIMVSNVVVDDHRNGGCVMNVTNVIADILKEQTITGLDTHTCNEGLINSIETGHYRYILVMGVFPAPEVLEIITHN